MDVCRRRMLYQASSHSKIAAASWARVVGRVRDYELFRDGSMRSYLEGLAIHLIGYRDIREALRSGALEG